MQRFIPFVVIVAFALAIAAKPTAAAPAHAPVFAPPVTEKEESTSAQAWASLCTWTEDGGEVCSNATLEVFNPDKSGGISACVHVTSSVVSAAAEPDPRTSYEVGCASLGAGQFSLAKDLAWAMLAPLSFDLYATVCDGDGKECWEVYSRTVTVGGDWSASSALGTDRPRSEYPQNNCTVKVSGVVNYRPTTTVVTIDGAEFAGEGMLTTSQFKRQIHCR